MCDEKYNDEVQEALSYLNFDDIPTMKELNTMYRRLALQKHPDKRGGSEEAKEDYQMLQRCYKLIGNFIVENVTSANDDEETDHVKAFKHFNFDQKNKFCHTVLIENRLSTAWKQVLNTRLGEPEDKGKNGLIYRVSEFSVNDELFKITVTLYEDPKDNKPKLHIQSSSQIANDEYILKELPHFYEDVRKIQPPETIGVEGVPKSRRGRPSKQTAKSIRTVKDLVNYCQVKSCAFTSKVRRDMTLHNQTHRREEAVNIQRNIQVGDSDREMEVTNDDDNEMDTAVDHPTFSSIISTSQPFDFNYQSKLLAKIQEENKELKSNISEREKISLDLEERITELEKHSDKMEKKVRSVENEREKAVNEIKEELTKAINKASELCEENTLLKERIKTFQNKEIADLRIQRKYEELVNVEKDSVGCQTEAEEEDDNIEALVLNKEAGFRRTDPSAEPVARVAHSQRSNTENNTRHSCDWCDVKCTSKHNLKAHISLKHHQCDICEIILRTPVLLRSHLKEIHDKKNGTQVDCSDCDFSALNEQHLKLHLDRHHKELSCNQCDFKTRTWVKLRDHIAEKHIRARNTTCKYWLENRCNRQHCQYKHEIVRCKFGINCNRINCRYEHPVRTGTSQRSQPTPFTPSPWTNPAFLTGAKSVESFPFLEKSCQCQRIEIRPRGI